MKQKQVIFSFLTAALLTACGNNANQSGDAQNPDSTSNAAKPEENTEAESSSTPTSTASTDAPAVALIQNGNIRFKLHSLTEVVPDASAPGKLAAGKKIYAADINAEYLAAHNTSAAEYMLSSYILDDKGNKLSLPLGSTKLAAIVSDAQAQQDNASGQAFNQSNPSAGHKVRGRQYGVEMDAANKPTKWGMVLDGKIVEVAINQ